MNIENYSVEDIKKEILSKRKTAFILKHLKLSGRLEKPHQYIDARKDVARLLTELSKRKNK